MHACRISILCDRKTSIFTHAVTQTSRFSLCVWVPDKSSSAYPVCGPFPTACSRRFCGRWIDWKYVDLFLGFSVLCLYSVFCFHAHSRLLSSLLSMMFLAFYICGLRTEGLISWLQVSHVWKTVSLVLITTTSTALTVHGVSGATTNVERGEACFDINSTSCHVRD